MLAQFPLFGGLLYNNWDSFVRKITDTNLSANGLLLKAMFPGKPRVLLADDHEGILDETKKLLSEDFDVVGTARDGVALVSAALELKPDVVVTDIKMPRLNGIDASREILRRHLCSAIVLLTVHGDPELVETALSAGICGYVLKVNAGEQLIPAVHKVLQGGVFVSPGL